MVNLKIKAKEKDDGLVDRLIHVNRVTKVYKKSVNLYSLTVFFAFFRFR